MEDVKLFNVCHVKGSNIEKNDFIEPILVGNKDFPEIELKVRDYYPELSNINTALNENEAEYYIWKNVEAEIKGQFQYSHQISLSKEQIKDILSKHKFIVFPIAVWGVYSQFNSCHFQEDIDLCIDFILNNHPEYNNSLENWKGFKTLFAKHIYVAKNDDYNKYMEFIWSVIENFIKVRNFLSMDDIYNYYKGRKGTYQERCIGYITERLFTWYIIQNYNLDEIYQLNGNEYKTYNKIWT